jgi:hypothetical protein
MKFIFIYRNGDTILSVSYKKTKNFFFNILNPDIYSLNYFQQIQY